MTGNGNGKASSNGTASSTCTVEPLTSFVSTQHIEHLHSEGFSDSQILEWQRQGLRTLTDAEAEKQGFKVKTLSGLKSSSGLYLPFGNDFGQLRLDSPIQRENGQVAKYLTPVGAKSQAMIPSGCKAITEGAKDGYAGSVHGGIPTGALAGVSHYRKALPQGAGYTIIFDADGWHNPAVFSNLFHAGKWLDGKIQLVPELRGEPKGGLCEYFKAGHTADDYAALLAAAMKPEAFLMAWPTHFGSIPAERLSAAIRTAFRLAAEFLDDIETETVLQGIRKATKLSTNLLKAELEKQRLKVNSKRGKEREKTKEPVALPTPLEQPLPSRLNQALERRANQILESGVLFDLVKLLLHKSGAVGIGEHVQVALASTIGTFRLDRRRSMPTLFTGSSGIGKSMILDALEYLLPSGSCVRVSGVSDAVLKRIGDTWKGKIIAIDEFSTWATSDAVVSTLKELISRGEASFEIAVPGSSGGWTVERFEVEGPIGLAACATEATIATVFGDAEEEIRSRFNEIPLPEDRDYIQRISRAAFSGLEPENLSEKYPRILSVLHKAISNALSRQVPKCDPLLEDALFQYIQPDRPLFPRLLKRLKILLENTAALLGKNTIDLETYAVVYPLVSKVFRRSLTSENDATLAQFAQLGKEVKDALAGGYIPFKIPKIQDALSCSKTQAYRQRDKWDSLGWIESSAYATYAITPKGVEVLKGVGGDNPGLPEILPPVDRLAAIMTKLAESRGVPSVFPYPKPSNDKACGDFIPKFSQVFPRFSQVTQKAETPINNKFEVSSVSEESQIPKQEQAPHQKNISQPSNPTPALDASEKLFPSGSLNPGNLGKPEEETEENIGVSSLSADGTLGKTLGKLEGETVENPVLPTVCCDGNFGKTLGNHWENLGNSQDTTLTSSKARAPQQPQQPVPPAIALASNPAADRYNLNIGDCITNSSGCVARIKKVAAGGWIADNGWHVSRDDLRAGIYAKVGDSSELTAVERANMLRDFASNINSLEFLELTQEWTAEQKREAWRLLPTSLQARYRQLRKGET